MSELEPRAATPVARPGWYPQPDGRTLWWDGYTWHQPAAPIATYAPGPPALPGPSGAVVAIAWVLAVLTFFYFLPWAIAASRKKPNHGMVALVNLLAGWTLIGWVAALVMACM